jgi:CheY-like chemotaxis protein
MKHCDILIIDDDIDDIELLTEILGKNGLDKVHYVFSAKAAIDYLEAVYPDCIPKVIVTDVLLPGINGLEFLTNLKAQKKFNTIKVVILSSSKSQQYMSKLNELGHSDFFEKPNDLNGYLSIINVIRNKINN